MTPVRCLTPAGIARLRRYLAQLRGDGRLRPPIPLLTDTRLSKSSSLGEVTIEPRRFASRRAFAEYIDGRLQAGGFFGMADEDGLWEWLSLYYFDAVCPPDASGNRTPGVDHRHLVDHRLAKYTGRHLLRGPYVLYRRFSGGGYGELDLLLAAKLPVYDAAATSLGERPRIVGSRGALIAASRLYFDQNAASHKRGYTESAYGLRSFCRFVNNLPPSFDLETMSSDTVLALLPDGFERWMSHDNRERRNSVNVERGLSVPDGGGVAPEIDAVLQALQDRPLARRLARVRSDLFRCGVLSAYASRCAISGLRLAHSEGETESFEVQAAHIVPVGRGGRDLIQNGLALNRTIHWAFDLGLLWVSDDLRVSVSAQVDLDQRNEWLRQFRGVPLALPADTRLRPHREALRWHATNIAAQPR